MFQVHLRIRANYPESARLRGNNRFPFVVSLIQKALSWSIFALAHRAVLSGDSDDVIMEPVFTLCELGSKRD